MYFSIKSAINPVNSKPIYRRIPVTNINVNIEQVLFETTLGLNWTTFIEKL